MRPVFRGDGPLNDAGEPIVFRDYRDARDPLIERIGDYCSYCEVTLPSAIDVEHVLPKSRNPERALDWSNFLFACANCNSIKGSQHVALDDYYWPDQDNTMRAYHYDRDEPPQVVHHADVDSARAQRTLELTGLDRVPGHPRYSRRDRRWRKRIEAWRTALHAQSNLNAANSQAMRDTIIELARATGFWSVWFTVFADDLDMRRRLIIGFVGTARDCFDDGANLQARRTGGL